MTLSELYCKRLEYNAREWSLTILIISVILLNFAIPFITYPTTYVLGILLSVFGLGVNNINYSSSLNKAFKRYKTGSLVSYKVSTMMAGSMWIILSISLVLFAFLPSPIMLQHLVLLSIFMFAVYNTSDVSIADNEVFYTIPKGK